MFATVSIKKNSRGNKDQVISNRKRVRRRRVHLVRASYGSFRTMLEAAPYQLQAKLKRQAPSSDIQEAFEPTCSSIKRQASSPKQQASSVKPQAASSVILDPWNMDIGEVLGEQGPRAFAMINVLCGCLYGSAIWCG